MCSKHESSAHSHMNSVNIGLAPVPRGVDPLVHLTEQRLVTRGAHLG